MNRREFLSMSGAVVCAPRLFPLESTRFCVGKTLVIVELKGGNDGLNTVVPYADPLYRALRPALALPRDSLLQLDDRAALNLALEPLMPLWRDGQLAVVQGIGHDGPNRSHFRSAQIWDTGSSSDRYLHDGWLARALAAAVHAQTFVIGSAEAGPFAYHAETRHVEARSFAASIEMAMRLLSRRAPGSGLTVLRLTLNGFDTHHAQSMRHAALLKELAEGLIAMRRTLTTLGCWDDALIVTCSEFGRSARENRTGGTDHGGASAHFVLGGRVRGGLHGAMPALSQIDGNGALPVTVDFRRLYAAMLDSWLDLDATAILGERIEPLPLTRV